MKQEEYVAGERAEKRAVKNKAGFEESQSAPLSPTEYTDSDDGRNQSSQPLSPNLRGAFRLAWQNRLLLLTPLLLACLGSLALLIMSFYASNSGNYQYAFQLTFNGTEDRQYPNGEPFSLQDIIAPNVINAVHERTVKNKSDVDIVDFQAAFSISAYSPSRDFILEKYRNRLGTRGLSFAESNEIQAELEAELNLATRRAAVITFDNSETNLGPEVVKVALEQVLREWSQYSIDTRGVQKLNLPLLEASFINEASIAGSGSSGILRSIVVIHTKVSEYIESLRKLQVGSDLRDPTTGQTFESLSTRVAILSTRIVEVAKGMLADTSDVSIGMGNMISSASFDLFPIDDVDPQIAFEVVLERLEDAQSNIRNIKKVPFGDIVRDPESGLTVTDLANALDEIESFQIKPLRDKSLSNGLSDDPTTLRTFYQQRLGDLQRKREAVGSVIVAVEAANSKYRNGNLTDNKDASNSNVLSNRNAVIPQFDGSFLDRLIAVTGDSKDSEFRQDLISRFVKLQEQAAQLDSDINVVKENLQHLEEGLTTPTTTARETQQESHRKAIKSILNGLKEQLDITVRISKRIALAESLTEVLVKELGLDADDRRIQPSTFLSASKASTTTVPVVLTELRGIVEISNRIKDDLAVAIYGSNALFSSIAEPTQIKRSPLNRQTILLVALLLVIGVMVSGVLFLVKLIDLR